MDEQSDIIIRIRADGAGEVIKDMRGVGNATQNMGSVSAEAHGKATAGAKGLSFAAKGLAHELGVTGGMARYFGHEAADMASSLGGAALVMGVVSLAAMATYKIYEYFSDASKKAREETLKGADASLKWIEAAKANKDETEELRKAKTALWEIEREHNILNLERGIKEQTKLISEQYGKIEGLKMRAEMDPSGGSLLGRIIFGSKEKREKEYQNVGIEARENIEKLRIMYLELDEAKNPNKLKRQDEGWSTQYANMVAQNAAKMEAIEQARHENTLANIDEMQQKENEWAVAKDQLEDYMAQRSYTREANNAIIKQKTEKIKQKAEMDTLDHSANAFKMMADLGGRYGREAFQAYQVAAIGRTIMTTRSAAMAAYEPPPVGVGPIWGSALAAAIIVEGAASVATIAAQKYNGGGSSVGSSGAIGTYNANPSTGLPSSGSSGGQILNLKLVINGSERDLGDITSGVLKTIFNNNGSVDGFSVAVERSA